MIPTLRWSKDRLILIDQKKLPHKFSYIECRDDNSVWRAIRRLNIRGAPAIGVAAGFGVYLGIKDSTAKDFFSFKRDLEKVLSYLATARPTAINLFWVLKRIKTLVERNKTTSIPKLKKKILLEAKKIWEEDRKSSLELAYWGERLIENGDRILTYCNAGSLATVEYGTALAGIYRARERGKKIEVFVCETRPFLQGARLTAWELKKNRIPVTLICDNMANVVMAQGKVNKVFVGSDRTVSNGDTANKVGTSNLAILANYYKIPFYVFCPLSSFDFKLKTGKEIPIEERDPEEMFVISGKRIAPKGIRGYYPCFDITPGNLITAIITEKGIFKPPYIESLKKIRKWLKENF